MPAVSQSNKASVKSDESSALLNRTNSGPADIFDVEFLKKLERLSFATKVIVSGPNSGNRKSRSKGSSVEFSDYREYAEGDDFRRVDWNAYGRFEKLFLKLFMEEREARFNLFLDTSKSMDFGEPHKGVAARRLCAALAYIVVNEMDRASVVTFSGEGFSIKESGRGKNSFPDLLSFLNNWNYSGATPLEETLRCCDVRWEPGVSILISDFFTQSSLESAIHYLKYRKQEIILCQILSPQELNPVLNGSVRLIDSETSETVEMTVTAQVIEAYRKRLVQFQNRIGLLCSRRGVRYCKFSSETPIEKMVTEVMNT